jgi:hypothetical protein
MKNKYNLLVSGNAPYTYPTEILFGLLYYSEEDALEVPRCFPFGGEWGTVSITHELQDKVFVPNRIDIVWLSLVEKKFYSLEAELPEELIENSLKEVDIHTHKPLYSYVIVGMAPNGGIALWLYGNQKSKLITWEHAESVNVDMKFFLMKDTQTTVEAYCEETLKAHPEINQYVSHHAASSIFKYDQYMQQFSYRYVVKFEQWTGKEWAAPKDEEAVFILDSLSEKLFDGTFDKLHDGNLLKYHQAGIPQKLILRWHCNKDEYMAHLWFEEQKAVTLFNRSYDSILGVNTDFVIHIDFEKQKFEVGLAKYDLKKVELIPDDAFQFIVFKNEFESFRSANYNQPHGSWIW